MFDEFIRELKRHPLNKGVLVPVDMPLDDKGYFDRRCPVSLCHAAFKVLFDDWRDKVPDEAAYCPKCGKRAEPSEFNTSWQRQYIADVGKAYVADQLGKAFGRAARRTRPKRISAGLFNIEMSVSYHARPAKVVLPPAAENALRQDITCTSCGCHFSTIGAGYFCPACGFNSPLQDFDRTIATSLKAVEGLEEIKHSIATKYDEDVAADIEQQILEDQIENLVTAFQRVSEALFRQLPNASEFTWDLNLFQRIADSSALWQRATGRGYDALLSSSEMNDLQTMVHRRHKIGHAQGIVDDRYVAKSGDHQYELGQRIVVSRSDVKRLAEIICKLVSAIRPGDPKG